jgi:hypothetical protein
VSEVLLQISKNNYLCTYDLYGPVRDVFDAADTLLWQVEGGWALEMESFGAM